MRKETNNKETNVEMMIVAIILFIFILVIAAWILLVIAEWIFSLS
jgi:competence protein ComGC